jgi:hypothetical protein
MSLERGLLSLLSTIEELLERNSRSSGLESREYGRRNPSRCPRSTLYPQKLALTLPANGGRSVGIVRSRTQATGFVFVSVVVGHLALDDGQSPETRYAKHVADVHDIRALALVHF